MPESVVASGGLPDGRPETLLRVRGLGKRFGRHVVLDDVDLVVNAGELVALVGENGAGKSTLVRCVAGDLNPDTGEIELADDRPPAIVWQDLALCENLDATANLFLGREIGALWLSDSDMELRAKALLDGLGIDLPDLHRPVGLLSGGQRQSLAIARALVGRPRLLILDEPTASLGVIETRAVERVMLGLRAAGCGLLLISHRIEQVFGIADRVVVLRHGRVVADRPTMELHPDDVVSLIAGIDAETTARKQMERLRSLVDQLAEVEPSASIPLIVSTLSSAVGADQVCVHLRVPEGDGAGLLRRRAAVGVPAALLHANAELPVGPGGGLVGVAAALGRVTVAEDVRTHPAWAPHRAAAEAAGVRSAWAMPIHDADGVLGVISVYADAVGRPQPAVLELAAMYTALAAAAIQRERLLGEVTRRNEILESLRGMLDTLNSPQAADAGVRPALAALCRGLRAEGVSIVSLADGRHVAASADDDPSPSPGAVTRSVPLASAKGLFALTSWWPSADHVGDDAIDLLHDAARSLSLAIEREEVAAERMEAESLRRTQRTQREFLSRLSHELRTPLTAIHGYASTLRQTDVDWDAESESRFLGVIVDESARMGRLVADLLDSSTIAVGALRLDAHWCDLELAVEAAARCVPGSEAVVHVAVAPAVRRVWADHDRLEQVLVNLIDNAVRHGPGGAVRVDAVPATEPRTVAITVTDSGPGFDDALLERAFEPYTRGETGAPGAGLGLAVCRGIIEAHGGSITVANTVGGNGEVRIVLPIEPESADSAESEANDHARL